MDEELKQHRKKMAKVIAKAWSDDAFKKKLLSSPRAVLEENGITVPPGTEVEVVEQTKECLYIVLPFQQDEDSSGKWMTEDDAYDLPCGR